VTVSPAASDEPADGLEAAGAAADELPASTPAGGTTSACPPSAAWIQIELVDEQGDPVADEPFRLLLPDGSEKLGKTDARGIFRVENIEAGDCTFSFTGLDQDAWSARD
jgi:hypothetical protein